MKINPEIIVRNLEGRKHYSIEYYDTDLKATAIGYGSFSRGYVEYCLRKDFGIVVPEGDVTSIMHDFIMSGLSEMRSNVRYSKADVMFLALHFLKEHLINENDVETIEGWYKNIVSEDATK